MIHHGKMHLTGPKWRTSRRSACGITEPTRWTTNPERVTCEHCRLTVHMADRIAAQQNRRSNR